MRDEKTYKVIDAAMEVHRELGCGFLEAVYQEALEKEFQIQRMPSITQPTVSISYKGKPLDKKYQPDFICFDEVIVEIKAIFLTQSRKAAKQTFKYQWGMLEMSRHSLTEKTSLLIFTFKEFLDFHEYNHLDLFSINERKIEISQLFDTYLEYGGFCETFLLPDSQKAIYRQSLIEKIILKDIINRYRIQKSDLIQNLFLYIARNPGSIVSAAKLGNVIGINDKTVSLFLSHLSSVFLLGRIDKYQWKTKKIFQTQKKYYLSDNLFTHLCLESRKLENIVYNNLIEKYSGSAVFFLRDEKGHEVDFVVTFGRNYYCYQVCVDLNDENEKREFRSLLNLRKYRSDQELKGDKYYLLFKTDSRMVKDTPRGIEIRQILEFVLTE